MLQLPERLERWLATLETLERSDRMQMLIDVAGRFPHVPPRIAQRPYPKERRVPGCESEATISRSQSCEFGGYRCGSPCSPKNPATRRKFKRLESLRQVGLKIP